MKALMTNKLVQNFFEGMVCTGGCLNGPLGLRHNEQMLVNVDTFGKRAKCDNPNASVDKFNQSMKKD
jgi:iron only hydrogenase large subunit-like protein